jgi:haloacetate dehalogenase
VGTVATVGDPAAFFEAFHLERVHLGEVTVRARWGGKGPPVVLLHGHPRTHTTWWMVAPELARTGHTVVCPDLRGYGASTAPPTRPDHAQASKRAMARDVVALMHRLGHGRFAVVGHDRGCYVAFRTALDHPDAVDRLVVMDGVPIGDALERCDARFAAAWWHWWFLGQIEKPAEPLISADPDGWYGGDEKAMGAENFADRRAAIHDPGVVHTMVEDYRAGLGVDREDDEADRVAGRQLACPVLFLWSKRDDMEQLYGDPLAIWKRWAPGVRGRAIDSGHHMSEEAPAEVADSIRSFLADS